MACRLFGAKPLPEPKMAYCQLDRQEKREYFFLLKIKHFLLKKMHLKMSSANVVAVLSRLNLTTRNQEENEYCG